MSSRFFPKKIRDDVYRLYSFVRIADDYVDGPNPQPQKLLALEASYQAAISDHAFDATAHQWDDIDTRIIKHIVRLQHKYKFDTAWLMAFFKSMKQDINPKPMKNLEASLMYVYGSAEVIGLMMAKILKLPEDAFEAAQAQGRAMQWINFIRDIDEDNRLGRCYFPSTELKKYGLNDLSRQTAYDRPKQFIKFVNAQIKRYNKWQAEADKGLHFIPEQYRVPIMTAVDMYNWTARQIEKDPFVVFKKKVKPRKRQIIRQIIKNTARSTVCTTASIGRRLSITAKKLSPATKQVTVKLKEAPQSLKQKVKELKNKYFE